MFINQWKIEHWLLLLSVRKGDIGAIRCCFESTKIARDVTKAIVVREIFMFVKKGHLTLREPEFL